MESAGSQTVRLPPAVILFGSLSAAERSLSLVFAVLETASRLPYAERSSDRGDG